MSWFFKDQGGDYGDRVLDALVCGKAWVPGIWPLEMANVLSRAEKKKIVARSDIVRFLNLVKGLSIQVAEDSTQRIFGEILSLATAQNLSAYDATYLDLAMREGIPIATLDDDLRTAARRVGVVIFE
ncbi:MAG: type II toxin-antitoxin system VapC family toxin [Magnetococcales bacterium]|nr:type II toxin-antitoxin system VapC family toxin [Magnetococcales bacterium]